VGTRIPTRTLCATALLLCALATAGCGRADDRDQARAAAERLYAAIDADDGAAACRELSPQAAEELESQEQSPCEEAVLDPNLLDLQPGTPSAESVELFLTSAAVRLTGGDMVFLDETKQGWRVSAFGCREQAPDAPAKCEVQA
jgi:hypothetical protein